MALVYLVTNLLDNKRYVGQTRQKLEDRWDGHLKSARYHSQQYVHRAIRKHGVESFEVGIIEECEESVLDERERHWIGVLNTHVTNGEGYNETLGGQGVPGLRHTVANVDRNRRHHLHKTQGEETCRLKSESMKASPKVRRRRVVQSDTDGNVVAEHASCCEAERALGKKGAATLVSRCCRGKVMTAYGFRWRYVDDDNFHNVSRTTATVRRVAQLSLSDDVVLAEFVSIAQAMRHVGKNSPAIRLCCHGKLSSAHGFRWKFVDADVNRSDDEK